jgi:competence ComEA-like helix-hairpin-helix protein
MAQVEIRDDLDRLNSVFAKSIARTSSKANPAAMSSPNPAKPLESSSDLIFLNTASNEDLERIPGIGPKLAAAIIEHRPLKRIEDLQSVPGIGQQKYEAAVTHLKQ